MDSVRQGTAKIVVESFDAPPPNEAVVVSFAQITGSAILESSLQETGYGQFSIFTLDPVEVVTIDSPSSGCPFSDLAKRMAPYPCVANSDAVVPFVGGWIGFFSYEAGLDTEHIGCTTHRDLHLPLVRLGLYDAAAIYDHCAGKWHVIAVDWPAPFARRRPSPTARLASLRKRVEAAAEVTTEPLALLGSLGSPKLVPIPNMSHDAYVAKVEQAKNYIEAGDIYQVNLTQRFTVPVDDSPLTIYRRLRQTNPASHASFFAWDDQAVLSSSPELFLQLRDGHVTTRPIKGTRPRTGDPILDATYRRELLASKKDRAELAMITDLLRNDLGRVCSFGSVRVTEAERIEAHPTVFHLVATIEGDLDRRSNWVDLLRATFPGGSVTGVPKIRAMQIIDQLESTARDVYCGSIGWIGLDGGVCMNIAIRTMIICNGEAHVYAGGAIVADSTAEQEYNEILAKAKGLLRALNCDPPARFTHKQEVTLA